MYSSDEWSESESDEDEDDKALAAVKARMGTYHQAVRDFCMCVCVCFGGMGCGDVALAAWGLFTPKAYHPHTHAHKNPKQPNTQQNHQPNSGGPAPAAVPAVGARTVAAAAATMP